MKKNCASSWLFTKIGFIISYQYSTTSSLEVFITVQNTDIKKGNRIKVYRKEICGMIWNKKVQSGTIRFRVSCYLYSVFSYIQCINQQDALSKVKNRIKCEPFVFYCILLSAGCWLI